MSAAPGTASCAGSRTPRPVAPAADGKVARLSRPGRHSDVPDPREARQGDLVAILLEVVAAEGPVLARRAYRLILQAAGFHRLVHTVVSPLNKAAVRAEREGRLVAVPSGDRQLARRSRAAPARSAAGRRAQARCAGSRGDPRRPRSRRLPASSVARRSSPRIASCSGRSSRSTTAPRSRPRRAPTSRSACGPPSRWVPSRSSSGRSGRSPRHPPAGTTPPARPDRASDAGLPRHRCDRPAPSSRRSLPTRSPGPRCSPPAPGIALRPSGVDEENEASRAKVISAAGALRRSARLEHRRADCLKHPRRLARLRARGCRGCRFRAHRQ